MKSIREQTSNRRHLEMYDEARSANDAELAWCTLRLAHRSGDKVLFGLCADLLRVIQLGVIKSALCAASSCQKHKRNGDMHRAMQEEVKLLRFRTRIDAMDERYFAPLHALQQAEDAVIDDEFASYWDEMQRSRQS